MTQAFDYFVVLADMRTGSNFLESNLNALAGVVCHGEAFNPHFISYPNRTETLGWSQADRDRDPEGFLHRFRDHPSGMAGFRYFHDHDPRVLDQILSDKRCAKIVLTRNPVDSYVSHKIARLTGQWKLTHVKRRKEGLAQVSASEFVTHVAAQQRFQIQILNSLQKTGQTAFYIAYEDLQDVDILNGLAQWLGLASRLDQLDRSLKPQNPGAITSKVENPEALDQAAAMIDPFNLNRTPNFEPRRGPAVPSYIAGQHLPLLFLPIAGGPTDAIKAWMAAQDAEGAGELCENMTQKQLRQWKRAHPGFRSLTVLRHPLARLHHVFCRKILSPDPGPMRQIRNLLRKQFDLGLPQTTADPDYDLDCHKQAFGKFVDIIGANLSGQTAFRTDPAWASQAQILAGFADVQSPDFVLREEELPRVLPDIARWLGKEDAAFMGATPDPAPFALSDIYDDALEQKIATVYSRDYLLFGFGPWSVTPVTGS
ncbi:sulfotransferase family 2 domain-containing protein [Phaeobacter sp.]|uniref:sulfotransferase family 2 domain-containing protein n=1 Tax=Phaeobacter sp. TaxID=1902409 RepID=UPI0025FF4540|nr:sulfotransferase family 2 domain-containing protein [Phaeobacter sp.]